MIIGIDEVGRGCWAGPLVVAGVGLAAPIEGLADSKKLSAKRRQNLDDLIRNDNNIVITSWISSGKIDELGLTQAMRAACQEIFSQISKEIDARVIIDGNINFLAEHSNTEAVIKADDTVAEVMAASIVAKQARDQYMIDLATEYPEYGFESNVGYGTKLHMEGLAKHGVTNHHRKSFKPIKKYVSETGLHR